MSKRHVKACPKEFREQVVKLALSCGRRPVRSPRSSRSRWIQCGDGSSRHSSTSVRQNARTSASCQARDRDRRDAGGPGRPGELASR